MERALRAAWHLSQKKQKYLFTIFVNEIILQTSIDLTCFIEFKRGSHLFKSTNFNLRSKDSKTQINIQFSFISTIFKSEKTGSFNSKPSQLKIYTSTKPSLLVAKTNLDLKDYTEIVSNQFFSTPLISSKFPQSYLHLSIQGRPLSYSELATPKILEQVDNNSYSITLSHDDTSVFDEEQISESIITIPTGYANEKIDTNKNNYNVIQDSDFEIEEMETNKTQLQPPVTSISESKRSSSINYFRNNKKNDLTTENNKISLQNDFQVTKNITFDENFVINDNSKFKLNPNIDYNKLFEKTNYESSYMNLSNQPSLSFSLKNQDHISGFKPNQTSISQSQNNYTKAKWLETNTTEDKNLYSIIENDREIELKKAYEKIKFLEEELTNLNKNMENLKEEETKQIQEFFNLNQKSVHEKTLKENFSTNRSFRAETIINESEELKKHLHKSQDFIKMQKNHYENDRKNLQNEILKLREELNVKSLPESESMHIQSLVIQIQRLAEALKLSEEVNRKDKEQLKILEDKLVKSSLEYAESETFRETQIFYLKDRINFLENSVHIPSNTDSINNKLLFDSKNRIKNSHFNISQYNSINKLAFQNKYDNRQSQNSISLINADSYDYLHNTKDSSEINEKAEQNIFTSLFSKSINTIK